MKRWRTWILCGRAFAGALIWLGLRSSDDARAVERVHAATATRGAEANSAELARSSSDERRAPSAVAPAPSETSGSAPAEDEKGHEHGLAHETGPRFRWTGHFEDSAGAHLTVADATVTLQPEAGAALSHSVRRANRVEFSDLAEGRDALSVISTEYRHRPLSLEIRARDDSTQSGGPLELDDDVVLWPANWIAVVVTTSDGRPFEKLAQDLQLPPKSILVGAFAARAFEDEPPVGAWPPEGDASVATFRPPPRYQEWQACPNVVGSLELRRRASVWVALSVFGAPVASAFVPEGASEVEFRLDAATFARSFATLALRVVEADGGRAVPDARATLLAQTSAHRRPDHAGHPADADGRIAFERVVPGDYELSVSRGDALVQQRLELRAGESRDLGDVAIGLDRSIEVATVGEAGAPCSAWIRVATYRAGVDPEELFPSLRSRATDSNGRLRLVIPAGDVMVCAESAGRRETVADLQCSEIALIESAEQRSVPLVLRLRPLTTVHFRWKSTDAVRIELADHRGLRIASPRTREPNRADELLLAGHYRATLCGVKGELLDQREFDVGASDSTVELR